MRPSKLLLGVGLAAALASGGSSGAREEFPERIRRNLGASGAPPCGLCHQYGKTGSDTLVTPFAWAMRARGLTGEGTSLEDALARVEADGVDSDGDGTPDIEEIVKGADPNSADSTPALPGGVRDPQLGCAVGGRPRDGSAGLALLLAALAWRSRRRGQRRPDPSTKGP